MDLDPRWDWVDVRSVSDPGPVWIHAGCRHLPEELEPISSAVPGQLALLCHTCQATIHRPCPHPADGLVSVDSIKTGQEVARICQACQAQLPPAEEPEMWRAVPDAPDYGIWMKTESIR